MLRKASAKATGRQIEGTFRQVHNVAQPFNQLRSIMARKRTLTAAFLFIAISLFPFSVMAVDGAKNLEIVGFQVVKNPNTGFLEAYIVTSDGTAYHSKFGNVEQKIYWEKWVWGKFEGLETSPKIVGFQVVQDPTMKDTLNAYVITSEGIVYCSKYDDKEKQIIWVKQVKVGPIVETTKSEN